MSGALLVVFLLVCTCLRGSSVSSDANALTLVLDSSIGAPRFLNNPVIKDGYRGTGSDSHAERPVRWRGPTRDTYDEAQIDIDQYKKDHPDDNYYFRVSRKGDPDFGEDD